MTLTLLLPCADGSAGQMRVLHDIFVAEMIFELLGFGEAEIAVGTLKRLFHFPAPKLKRHSVLGPAFAVTFGDVVEKQIFRVVRRQTVTSAKRSEGSGRNKSSKDRTWSAVPDALLGVIS